MVQHDPLMSPGYSDDEYPLSDWQYEVANGDTRRGYDDWVAAQREADLGLEGASIDDPLPVMPMSEAGLSRDQNLNPILSNPKIRQEFVRQCLESERDTGSFPANFSIQTASGTRQFDKNDIDAATEALFAEREHTITETVTYVVPALDQEAALLAFLDEPNRDQHFSPTVIDRSVSSNAEPKLRAARQPEPDSPSP